MPIDKILYINLERRPDRNMNVLQILKKNNLEEISYRVNAVDGNKLNKESISLSDVTEKGIENAYNKNLKVYVPLTVGGIGCALSHKACYQYIIDNKINKCLILEDDIRINDTFLNDLNNIDKIIPDDFDIFALGYHSSYTIPDDQYDLYHKTHRFYGLFGYIVSYNGAQKLLNVFPITDQIDSEISLKLGNMNGYALNKDNRIIFSDLSQNSREFGTDIQVREHFEENNNNNTIFFATIILFLIFCFLLYLIYKKCIRK